jgi:hypothetical protein
LSVRDDRRRADTPRVTAAIERPASTDPSFLSAPYARWLDRHLSARVAAALAFAAETGAKTTVNGYYCVVDDPPDAAKVALQLAGFRRHLGAPEFWCRRVTA